MHEGVLHFTPVLAPKAGDGNEKPCGKQHKEVLSTLLLSHSEVLPIPKTETTLKAGTILDQWDWRAQYPAGPGPMTEDDGFWGQHLNSCVVVIGVTLSD